MQKAAPIANLVLVYMYKDTKGMLELPHDAHPRGPV